MLHDYAEDLEKAEEKIHNMGFSHVYDGKVVSEINEAYHFVEAMYYVKGELPDKLTQEQYDELHTYYSYFKSGIDFHEKEELKIFTTKFSETVIKHFEGVMSSEEFNPKFSVFFGTGHELYAFLEALNLTSEKCLKKSLEEGKYSNNNPECRLYPTFGSSLTFELSYNQEKSNYYVRILYNGVPVKFCDQNDGDYYCTMFNFVEAAKSNLIDFEIIKNLCKEYKELRNILQHTKEESSLYKWGSLIGMVLFGVALLCLILECCFRKRDKKMIERTLERYRDRMEQRSQPGSSGSLENA